MRRGTRVIGAAAALAAGMAASSCGDVIRQSRSPVVLVVNSLTGSQRGSSGTQSGTLLSDVINITAPAPCSVEKPCLPGVIFDDFGTATFTLVMKDTTVSPTTNNGVTLTRYRVDFTRADGRNTPGVDVPYGFDGGLTLSLGPGGTGATSFELVRHVAKQETPLVQLATNRDIITTIATVTFYGTDTVGNQVSAVGKISVNFGNFADQ